MKFKTMKNVLLILGVCISTFCIAQIDKEQLALSIGFSQIDKEQLALTISKADDANTEKLKAYIWKRKSDVSIGGEHKLTTLTEFSFDEQGKLQAKMVDAESSVKQKPGLRGKVQQNAAEDKMDYVGKALELSLAYTYMTKGQLLDFFGKGNRY